MQAQHPHSKIHPLVTVTLDLAHLLPLAANYLDKQELNQPLVKDLTQAQPPHSKIHHQQTATLKHVPLQKDAASFQDRLVLIITLELPQVVFIKSQILANTH